MLSTMDLIETSQRCYEIPCMLLAIYVAATAVQVMCKCCSTGFGHNLNPYSQCFLVLFQIVVL